MPTAHDITGMVFQDASAVLLARVVGSSGTPLAPSSIQSAEYTIFELDETDESVAQPVLGHTQQSLTVNSLLSSSLQHDSLWDVDAQGYNFRHELDATAHSPFPHAGLFYRVVYKLTPTSGQPIVIRFRLRAI
jgi:hypothetical protein